MKPQPALWIADLALLLVALIWGTSYGVAKQAIAYYPVLGFLAIRFLVTFLLLSPTLRTLANAPGRAALRAGIPVGLVLLTIFLCETYGVAHTSASNAAFLISLCVVLTPFVEWGLLRRQPHGRAFLMAALSLCGAWLLTSDVHLGFNLGDGLMLAAALLRAFGVCLIKKLTEGKELSSLTLTAVQSGVIGLGSLILAVFVLPGGLPALPAAPRFWGNTLYLVLLATLFAFFAQNYAIRRTSPTRVALLTGSEPVFGALFATLWLGEHPGTAAWLGGALIVGASFCAALPQRQGEPKGTASEEVVGT